MRRLLPILISLLMPGVFALPQGQRAQSNLDSLVEAERSFSRTCVAKGLRASFIQYFADDGIRFLPHPVNAQENFRQRPAPSTPQAFTLSWEPVFADVSLAGDLGFTTGPYVLTDNAKKNPPGYGYYFSIWRKQQDGSWKVLLDYGTDAPAPSDAEHPPLFKSAIGSGWKRPKPGLADSTVLASLDREASALSAKQGITATYRHYLLSDARLHRAGRMPLVEKNAILSYLDGQALAEVSFESLNSGIAQSLDLGYTYGKYFLRRKDAPDVLETGYYARVWKRDRKGSWKILMDVANALPSESGSQP